MPVPAELSTTKSIGHPLSWAAFLGVSWTWCIGMFLPVIMLREFGLLGWIIFAVPNVIGAAGVGWLIRDRASSRRMVQQHRVACLVFSLVTILFQFYFAVWIIHALAGLEGRALTLTMVLLFYVIGRVHGRRDLPAAGVAWVASIVLIGIFLMHSPAQVSIPLTGRSLSPINLLAMSGVCAFGFAFCPYLDLTFHRARRSLDPSGSRLAFGVGFGLVFLTMIIGTLLYAVPLHDAIFSSQHFSRLAAYALAGHFIIQVGFTVGIHHREVTARAGMKFLRFEKLLFFAAAIGLLCDGLSLPFVRGSIGGPELVYRLFMAFYGLIFPAYVWLCIVPPWKTPPASLANRAWTCAGAVALAAPMYWMGFIEQKFPWLLLGLAVVLAAKLLPIRAKN